MSAATKTLPHFKGLWCVISGTTCRCEKKLVQEEILNATESLKNGLLPFKPYTEGSMQKIKKPDIPNQMYEFVAKLAPCLVMLQNNLDASVAWDIVCNYMQYEYRNCAETFASQLKDLTSTNALIEDIWNFYFAERLTLIKCLKLMVEFKHNKHHPHQKEFDKFFKRNPLLNFVDPIRKQIEMLKFINAPTTCALFYEDHLHFLYNRILIEMRELLHILTIIVYEVTIPSESFKDIYESIVGEPRRLTSFKSHEEKEAVKKKIQDIQYSQAALLLVLLDVFKNNDYMEDWIVKIRTTMQDTLERKCIRDNAPENGPLLLAWMLANYAIEADNPDVLNRYRPFGVRALHLNVFFYLKDLMESEMIKEDTQYASTVRTTIYNLLVLLASYVDDERLDTFSGLFDLISVTLKYAENAERFWSEKDRGIWSFYKYAIQWFPFKFDPLTKILTGLAAANFKKKDGRISNANRILQELENLPSITLEVPRQMNLNRAWSPYKSDCFIQRNDFTIPSNCPLTKFELSRTNTERDECEIVIFHTKSNYWDAFHYKIEQLFQLASGGIANLVDVKTSLPEQVARGFSLLEALLSTDIEISNSIVIPTELSFEIVNRFAAPVLPPSIYNIIACCLRIFSKLVLRYPKEVLAQLRTGIFPRFNDKYQKTSEFAQAVSFDGGLIASWLSSIETITHTYPILNAYLDTLANYLIIRHSKEAMYTIEIPGMILLLQSVLSKLDSWYFSSQSERIELWLKSIICLHRALDTVSDEKEDSRNELRLIVTYNLLHLEPRHALLKLVRTGERALRNKMMNETDWITGKGFKVMKSVQLALSVVNRLLMYRKTLGLNVEKRSPLEAALYASPSLPNGLLIVPTIVDYLYVWFSPTLQAMAVRLLKKFAEGFSMSLLVCMGMDGTSIRETFASRLMSPICAAEVKVSILELVTVCLDKQPGLTEALFNIMHQAERKRTFPRPADEFFTEGCTRFLDLYLKRVQKEDDIIHDRLYDSTMSLLRAMWYHRNEILVGYFRKRADFWTNLLAPIFRKLEPGVLGYYQLFDIITLELFKSNQIESDFLTNLKKLLDPADKYWQDLTSYVLDGIPMSIDKMNATQVAEEFVDRDKSRKQLYEKNLESWYQLLVVVTDERISKTNTLKDSQILSMTHLALDRTLNYLKQLSPSLMKNQSLKTSTAKVTILLTSISLRCVTSLKRDCAGDSKMKSKIADLMQEVAQSYRSYGKSLKQILIALLIACVDLISTDLKNDNTSLEYLLGQACTLTTEDLEELKKTSLQLVKKRKLTDNQMRSREEEATLETVKPVSSAESMPATLTVSLVTRLLGYKLESLKYTNHKRFACMQLQLLVPELMICLTMTLQKKMYATFSKAALNLLGTVARSPYDLNTIDPENSSKLWLALTPPADIKNSMLASLYNDCVDKSKWTCEDWWSLYTTGLEFLTGLITNETGPTYICQVITFLGSHEHLLLEISTLLRHTADPLAADLIQSLIVLISLLSTRNIFWENIPSSVRETLVKCTHFAYDSTVNLLLRPRILKFIIDGISVESAEELQSCDETLPSGELKLLVNKLILINTFCAQSFVNFSPRLNALVDTIYEQDDFWYAPMAETNFGPPQMSINSVPRLTYGTIISSTQLFTQAQLHSSQTQTTVPAGTSSSTPSKDDTKIDSARKEWERATPENLRRLHAKDLRKILYSDCSTAVGSTAGSNIDYSNYWTGLDVTVPLLGNPRLIRRPFDPLICENTILSRATTLVPVAGRIVKNTSPNNTKSDPNKSQKSSRVETHSSTSDPWFACMEKNNTRLALEVNLVLILCQALEGVKSPRLILRDRQLIARETATEVGVLFDFLENRSSAEDWTVTASLVDDQPLKTVLVKAKDNEDVNMPARLNRDWNKDGEKNIVTTGCFNTIVDTSKLLQCLGKLLKTMTESHDATRFG